MYADAHGVTRAKNKHIRKQAAPGGRAAAKNPLCNEGIFCEVYNKKWY